MPTSYRQALGIGDDYRLEVTPGDEYVVYGVGVERELVWFYLCAGYGDSVPVRYPLPLLSNCRCTCLFRMGSWLRPLVSGQRRGSHPGNPRLGERSNFYTRLTDLDDDAARVFRGYKRIIDAEAYGEDGVDVAEKD